MITSTKIGRLVIVILCTAGVVFIPYLVMGTIDDWRGPQDTLEHVQYWVYGFFGVIFPICFISAIIFLLIEYVKNGR
jgi:hypothetical protein